MTNCQRYSEARAAAVFSFRMITLFNDENESSEHLLAKCAVLMHLPRKYLGIYRILGRQFTAHGHCKTVSELNQVCQSNRLERGAIMEIIHYIE